MSCYYPITGYRSTTVNDTGKRSIVFNRSSGYVDMPVTVPCGQCIGCRLERSRQWAARCMHEASMHTDNCFITLTFSDEYLPSDGSLHVEDFQLFIKRFRKSISPNKLRYFHCGEYGNKLGRPHHHACIFGYDFPDRKLFSRRDGVRLYTSDMLSQLWPFGFSTVGDVTFESAAYVARYVLKKITGLSASDHYQGRHPEYVTMSRRPGIGGTWLAKYGSDVYPHDYMVIRGGIKSRPPRYYDNQLQLSDPVIYNDLKLRRQRAAENNPNANYQRREAADKITKSKSKQLKRSFEND